VEDLLYWLIAWANPEGFNAAFIARNNSMDVKKKGSANCGSTTIG
jgi:hypothetical protein